MKKSPWLLFNAGLFIFAAVVLYKQWTKQNLVIQEIQNTSAQDLQQLEVEKAVTVVPGEGKVLTQEELQRMAYESLPPEVKASIEEFERQKSGFPLIEAMDNVKKVLGGSGFETEFEKYLKMRFENAGKVGQAPMDKAPAPSKEDFKKIKEHFSKEKGSIIKPEIFELYAASLGSEVPVDEKMNMIQTALESVPSDFKYASSLQGQILQTAKMSQIPEDKLKPLMKSFNFDAAPVPIGPPPTTK